MVLKAVEITDLTIKFNDNVVLKNINISIDENDFVAIIGPNGGGKSTLLKAILGLLKPHQGCVKVFNKDPKKVRTL